MARKAAIKVTDLLNNDVALDLTEGEMISIPMDEKAMADAVADFTADAPTEEDDDEGLTPDQLRQIGEERLAKLQAGQSIQAGPIDNSGPKMTAKQKERVINRDTAGTPAADDPSTAHEPKTPKLCLFSGLPTGGGKFRPGYDAKLKSALIRRFRGEKVDTAGMSEVLAARFGDGDLATSEGALAYMIDLDWGHFATTKAAKMKAAADSRTPVEVLQQTIESALRKYGAFEDVEDVIASVMEVVNENLPAVEDAA
jgi:hypothetical protein